MNKDFLINVLKELNILANSNYDSNEDDMASTLQLISSELEMLILDLETTEK